MVKDLISEMEKDSANKMLLNVRDAARRLSICRMTLWTFTKDGVIPYVKIGRRVLYDPNDLKAWIEANKKVSKKEGV
jgi:excisionase family DNA binding protein